MKRSTTLASLGLQQEIALNKERLTEYLNVEWFKEEAIETEATNRMIPSDRERFYSAIQSGDSAMVGSLMIQAIRAYLPHHSTDCLEENVGHDILEYDAEDEKADQADASHDEAKYDAIEEGRAA